MYMGFLMLTTLLRVLNKLTKVFHEFSEQQTTSVCRGGALKLDGQMVREGSLDIAASFCAVLAPCE